jgi:hypothetical protein
VPKSATAPMPPAGERFDPQVEICVALTGISAGSHGARRAACNSTGEVHD